MSQFHSFSTGSGEEEVFRNALVLALSGSAYLRNVVVVDTPDELPERVQAFLKDKRLNAAAIKGAYAQGHSFLVASNLESLEDGIRTALHEVVGHEGVRALLAERFEPVMLNLYHTFPRQHEAWITTGKRYAFLDAGTDAGRVAFAEELTAHLAETNAEVSELNMVYAEIRAQLRAQVPDLPFTQIEVLALIQRTRESLTLRHGDPDDAAEILRRQSERVQASVAWAKEFIGKGASFDDWFQGSRVVDDIGAPHLVYHGTDSEDFDVFEMQRATMRYTTLSTDETQSQGASFSPYREDAEQYGRNVKAFYLALHRPFPDPGYQHTASDAHADVLEVLAPLIYQDGEGEDALRYIDVDNGISRIEVDEAGAWVDRFFIEGMIEWAPLDNPEVVSKLKSLGYDGAKVLEEEDSAGYSWFVVDPAQIRPASDREAPDHDATYDESSLRLKLSETAFERWFKKSQVTDTYNKPKVVYHGSPDIRGILEEGFSQRPSRRGSVFFFSDDYHVADTYTDSRRAFDYQNAEPYTLPCYLSMQNPYIVNGAGRRWRETEKHIELAKEAGHDGIIIRNSRDEYNNTGNGGRLSTVYAVFDPTQIKSAGTGLIHSRIDGIELGDISNLGTFETSNPDIRLSFSGESAKTADAFALEEAQTQLLAGIGAERVRQQTGWFKGPDDKWRFEIDDSMAALTPDFSEAATWGELEGQHKQSFGAEFGRGVRLDDVIDHPRLFAAYPHLAELIVTSLEPEAQGASRGITQAAYSPGGNDALPELRINRELPIGEVLSTLLHELQHAIQRAEGFAVGGSPSKANDRAETLNMRAFVSADQRLRELGEELPEVLAAYNQLEGTRLTLYGAHGISWKAPDASSQLRVVMTAQQQQRMKEASDAYYAAVEAHGSFDSPTIRALIDAGTSRSTAARQSALTENEAQALYERLYGEVEARNVQARQSFSATQRKSITPELTQDTPSDETVVVFNGRRPMERFDSFDHHTANVAKITGKRLMDVAIDLTEVLDDHGLASDIESEGSRVLAEALNDWSGGKVSVGVICPDGSAAAQAVGVLAISDNRGERVVILSGKGITTEEALLWLRRQAGNAQDEQLITSRTKAEPLVQQLPMHDGAAASMANILALALGPYEEWEGHLMSELNATSSGHPPATKMSHQVMPGAKLQAGDSREEVGSAAAPPPAF